ncbi:hypothetical protein ACFWOT_09155 [Streptomyces sp. NPDC058440]|uniref:hypothetical protein n=1 Tax=Streptomyces sp. NPDC058440 TaxID=3346501 RepID=UPI00365521CC
MTPTEILALVSPLAAVSAAAVVVLAQFRTSAAKVWKGEAEAHKERADRLEKDLSEIKERLARIEQENARLIQLLTALDPSRLTTIRLEK